MTLFSVFCFLRDMLSFVELLKITVPYTKKMALRRKLKFLIFTFSGKLKHCSHPFHSLKNNILKKTLTVDGDLKILKVFE